MGQKGTDGFKRINMLPVVLLSACTFLLLLIVISGASSAKRPVTCDAGNFTIGEPASVTCNFGTNITAIELSITIVKYPADVSKVSRGKYVCRCPLSPEKRHECFIVPEMEKYYTFDGALTDRLTLSIPKVSPEHEGLYLCSLVPPEGTDPHLCELQVQRETKESQDFLQIVLPCVFLIVAACCVGFVILLRNRLYRRRTRRPHIEIVRQSSEPPESTLPMIPSNGKMVERCLEQFQLCTQTLKILMNQFNQELSKFLSETTMHRNMVSAFVSPLPDLTEIGYSLVLDLRDDHLCASLHGLGHNTSIIGSQSYEIREEQKRGTVDQLFEFIADTTKRFIDTQPLSSNTPLALIIAFPCKRNIAGKRCLAKRTSELNYMGAVDTDLHGLLQDALVNRCKKNRFTPRSVEKLRKLEIVAVVNDKVSTLAAVTSKDSNCKIGLTVGTRLNACYTRNATHFVENIPENDKLHEEIINTEFGALGEHGCLDICRTAYDKELDKNSSNPGNQVLDKMVSSTYIGEIVRLMLIGLTREGIFQSVPVGCAFFKRDSLSIDHVLAIEQDEEEPSQSETARVLKSLGVTTYTDEDIETVRRICSLVCVRAAFLAAAILATLIDRVNQPEVTVVVDGDLFRRHPRFHDLMYNKTLELIKPGLKFYLVSPCCKRSIGAARIAAASLRLRNTR